MSRPRKVLVLGSGGLRIGQAGEFDYSGSQALKALREEGVKSVLVNPNIATVQTDPGLADEVYLVPVTPEFVADVIARERPDGILLGFGGQTALNVGLELDRRGVLRRHRVRVLGTPTATIETTEDRLLFARALRQIGVEVAASRAVSTVAAARAAAARLGYPVMVRAAYSLGGEGSGVARDERDLVRIVRTALAGSPQVLVEEYLAGWKEVEYEVVRDSSDACITVCNMENLDPMGVHTGDSAVVAPSQTLTNEEYQRLRDVAIRTVRHLGVVGECNIQYALHPRTGDYRVIEVNARLSRSSALASKATGYPLAFVAAKLALGHRLAELENSVTKVTASLFEPALDYVALKLPRWDLHKFPRSRRVVGTQMQSVGEAMALGRTFEAALQRGARMLNIGADGLVANRRSLTGTAHRRLAVPTDRRLFAMAEAMWRGASVEAIHRQTKVDRWFLGKIENIVKLGRRLRSTHLSLGLLRRAKELGFSDRQIATLRGTTEAAVRRLRGRTQLRPVVKQIDTLAGEFPSRTSYLYSTYAGRTDDVGRLGRAVVVLGSGPYSIGSSVEFDWCAVQACRRLSQLGYRTVMVNCNPETVSTDFDAVDRLYFDELSVERILDVCRHERPLGVVASFGGQVPNSLALELHRLGVRVLGTSPVAIDAAEDRHKFSSLLDRLRISQPAWTEVRSVTAALAAAERFGYPVLVRPSYVLSGTAMNVAFTRTSLERYLREATSVSADHPVVLSRFIAGASEVELDGVAAAGRLVRWAVTEHIEDAGTHSGDATVVLPTQRLDAAGRRQVELIASKIARAMRINGPFNIQLLRNGDGLKVIECNLRASRSFPFVSKATGVNLVAAAVDAMLGRPVARRRPPELTYVAVKSPQFSHHRIDGADPLGYVEMASTGEVACLGRTLPEALLRSMIAADFRLPRRSLLLSVGGEANRLSLLPVLLRLPKLGLKLYATEHTADFLRANDVPCTKVYKLHSRRRPNVGTLLRRGAFDLIINVPKNYLAREVEDGYVIRRAAVERRVPVVSNLQMAAALVGALEAAPPQLWRAEPYRSFVRAGRRH